jgi:chloride channel 3/4/5
LSKDEQALADTAVGERLAYNDYTTIDWLHDLVRSSSILPPAVHSGVEQVKDSFRFRSVHGVKGVRGHILSNWDACQGWVAAALIGILTACVAFLVDMSVATMSDWKFGYCKANAFASRDTCCTAKSPFVALAEPGDDCKEWQPWTSNYARAFGIYVGFALTFGITAGGVTMTTKKSLPATAPGSGDSFQSQTRARAKQNGHVESEPDGIAESKTPAGKAMYMAAGFGR